MPCLEVYRYLAGSTDHPLKKPESFKKELETLIFIHRFVAEQVYKTRAKDYTDSFRTMTYRNSKEIEQVLGNAGDNSFVKLVNERLKKSEESVRKLAERLGLL